jgi:hypothetical protein
MKRESAFPFIKKKLILGSSPKDSNPQPFAPLGSAPAPRAPRVLPPLSAPLPLTPAPPGSLRSGSVAGTGGVATRCGAAWIRRMATRCGAAWIRRSSCEPPSDQPQAACLPPMSGGAASAGGGVYPPCMRHRRSACATSRDEAPRAPSVAFCIVQGSVLPFGDAPCVCFNGRDDRGRGRPVSAARKPREKPRGTATIVHPSLHTCTCTASARRERSSAIERVLLQMSCCGWRVNGARKGRTEKR